MASVNDKGAIRIWDPDVGRPIGRPLKGPSCPMTCMVASSAANDGPRLVTTGGDCIAHVWDPGNGRQLNRLSDGEENPCDVVLVGTNWEDRIRLTTSGLDRFIRPWDIATGRIIYAVHTLDYAETIISFRYGNLAVNLDDGRVLLRPPPGVQGITIPSGPIVRPNEGLAPGPLARTLHRLSKVT